MAFHLGKPILVMLLISLISGGILLLRCERPPADLTIWVFHESHASTYQSIIGQFEQRIGKSVDIQLLSSRAENVRLESMFMSGQTGSALPDVVEIEIGQVGKFFRPPVAQIGLLPLNDLLRQSGWDERIISRRFAPWSKKEAVFGVPHDVHPVAISYRQDLFEQAGIKLQEAGTWAQFQRMCLEFQSYWRARGFSTRHAVELPRSSSTVISCMLLQRGVNVVDQHDNIHINEPIVADTIAFYAQLVAGSRKIGSESAGGSGVWTNDAIEGNLCAFVTPDWRVFDLRRYAPQLEGKLRMMPLPRFDPSDAPTSTWGGTMIGITRDSLNHADAWKLIEFLYLSPEGLAARQKVTSILPPVIEWWDQPIYHREDRFYGGQRIDELFVELARQIPRRYVTPVTPIADAQLAVVLNRAVKHVETHGTIGLVEECQRWLDFAAADLRARIKHGRFEE